MNGLSATSIVGSTNPPFGTGPLPSPQYGPAWVADCYGITVDTMNADLVVRGIDTADLTDDEVARAWAPETGVTVVDLLDTGAV
jgi:hypothetical protein